MNTNTTISDKKCVRCNSQAGSPEYPACILVLDSEVFTVCKSCFEKEKTKAAYDELRPAIDILFRALNGGSAYWMTKGFVEGIRREHRTLQQKFGALILGLIRYYAGLSENEYDLRNEALVAICKRIERNTPEIADGLPLI